MITYALLNKDKICIGTLETNNEINNEMYVATESSENIIGKKYVNGSWVEYVPESIMDVPTEQELVYAEILLNQATQDTKLAAIDETMAEVLLNTVGGALNV